MSFFADRRLASANLVVKAALVLLLLHAAALPDLEQYAGKGTATRLLSYPISIVVVPLIDGALARRGPTTHPHLIDICVGAPFVLDTLGNALNLYNSHRMVR